MNKENSLTKLYSVGINLLISFIATLISLWQQDWFGSGDTYAFMFWAIPLAVGLAVSGETILNLFRTMPFLFRLLFIMGVAGLASFCWLYGVGFMLGAWMGAFSFSLFYKWVAGCMAQLLFLDRYLPKPTEASKKSKILLGLCLFPVTLVVVVMTLFGLSALEEYLTRPEKTLVLLPKDYRGEVYILFDETNGASKVYEDKRRIYKIPNNGVLFTQFKAEYGRVDDLYFFVDSMTGKRTEILSDMEWNSVKNRQKSSRDSATISNNKAGKSGKSHFAQFFVVNYEQPITSEGLSFKRIDSIREEYIKNKGILKK